MRRIHHGTDHKAAESLWHVRAIGEIIEGTVAQRRLHLRGKIVTVGEHLDTHIHLVQVGQGEVFNRDNVPSPLLQSIESDQSGSGDDVAVGIGHEGTHSIVRIGNVGLVIVVFHCGHHQLVNRLDAHARTDDSTVITCKLAHSRGVGIVEDIVRHLHSPMGSVVGIQLVVSGTDLHILDLQDIVVMTREGHHRLGTGCQRSNRQRVVVLLGSACHIQVNLDIALCLTSLVTNQGLHHILHFKLGRSLTMRIDVRHCYIIVVQVSQTDTVNIDVVAVLRLGVEGDIDATGGHIVGEVVCVACPLGRIGGAKVTFQQGG